MKTRIALLLALLLTLFACGYDSNKESTQHVEQAYLPTRAVALEKLGNGWIYFELDSVVYLYRKETAVGGFTYEAISTVPELIASQLKTRIQKYRELD